MRENAEGAFNQAYSTAKGSGDFLAEASAEVAARTMERSLEVISTSTAILNGFKKDGEEVVQDMGMIVADLQERIRLMLNLEGVEEDPAYKQSKHTVQEIINNINKIREGEGDMSEARWKTVGLTWQLVEVQLTLLSNIFAIIFRNVVPASATDTASEKEAEMNEPADDNPKNAGEDASTNPSKVEERLAAIPEQKENKTAGAVPKRTENPTSNKAATGYPEIAKSKPTFQPTEKLRPNNSIISTTELFKTEPVTTTVTVPTIGGSITISTANASRPSSNKAKKGQKEGVTV